MSRISFLDNASQGKNNWWRYFLTIILTFGVGTIITAILIIIISLVYSIYAMTRGFYLDINSLLSDPLFMLAMVAVEYIISFLFFYISVKVLHKRSLMSLINTVGKISWMKILKGASIWTAIMMAFSIVPLLVWSGELGYSITFNSKTFGLLLILTLITFPIQASFEEIFFRGYLMQGFGLFSKKPVIPLIATSVIFALMHFFNGTDVVMSLSIVLSTLIIGLMLGTIALGENRIETAMGAHIANNVFIALIYNSSDSGLGNLPSAITVQASDPYSGILLLVIAALIMITVVFWNKKDDLFNVFRLKNIDNNIDT
ncbi:CPBP family intramembrane glutamic endopeptidase [Methanobacterium paludis]|uniref:Abortive infection protein n=1 Tax=Methanobacterium paludis (strain DSM 25820 / JCM 18151 / SWAN1) TaxID=868131 RepID=F6D2F3_METPW|nr:type II CAAX endopeptidase family protein [Methanobacterium paludis]AEG19085.1 Abortive infection protein [Methanobacterium paludis]